MKIIRAFSALSLTLLSYSMLPAQAEPLDGRGEGDLSRLLFGETLGSAVALP
jgi:hypothetical protein